MREIKSERFSSLTSYPLHIYTYHTNAAAAARQRKRGSIMAMNQEPNLHDIVDKIMESYKAQPNLIKKDAKSLINDETVIDLIGKLRRLLFVGFFERKQINEDYLKYYVGELTENILYHLEKQIARALEHRNPEACRAADDPLKLAYAFLHRIPALREILASDLDAAYDGDPAAYNKDEIILSYPGLFAITVNRIAHELYALDIPLIPRMMTEHAHSLTGIDIHPGASIGHHFFIDHGTGIVIGETTEIGNHVKIYQGVTLGALSTRAGQGLRNKKRHPTIHDRVTIYAGASILGGQTIIGEDSVISANAFIIESVPPGTRVGTDPK